ncbi:MAG: hypothetical protein HY322_20500 [Betaproteobacteria bacterium]|nr:hypothetical protein [Betaproteobacteria bacterium]
MRAFLAIVALCAGLAAAAPVAAEDADDAPALTGAEQILRGLVRERDVSLLFDFVRESLIAGIQGREPPPAPDELTGRAEVLGRALKAQGALAALALLAALEQRAKQALREAPTPRPVLPPASPSTPL